MKPSIFFMLVIMLIGCVQQPVKQQEVLPNNTTTETERATEVKPKENPRVAFLKDQAQLAGLNLEYFYEVDSLFSLMKDLQDGEITTNDLSEALFYFEDTVGDDGDLIFDRTYFKCIQVIALGEETNNYEEKVPTYLALYTNYQIDITVSVVWFGTRPLKGQKLNVDFLAYGGVDTYKNINNEDMERVTFVRPFWAGSNGYTDD